MAVRRKRTGHAGATKDDGTQAVRSVPLDTVFEGGALSGKQCAVTYRGQLAHRPW